MDDLEISVENEISQADWKTPHVVLLGAGASRATCASGDKNGKALPLMADFATTTGLRPLLERFGLNPDGNFEDAFSELWARKQTDAVKEIETAIEGYFGALELPDSPTIYDHLVLSLRGSDLIATFNWDPLLMQAYVRSRAADLTLPRLAFLHGNVCAAYCPNDRVAGPAGARCRHCGKQFVRAPLLYPVKEKNYAANQFIANEWQLLKWGYENAFMITIFGYSGPKTDQEALAAMQAAWGDKNQREMEQTALIVAPSDNEERVSDQWDRFIHTHHLANEPLIKIAVYR